MEKEVVAGMWKDKITLEAFMNHSSEMILYDWLKHLL
jgi:hypothetical protein